MKYIKYFESVNSSSVEKLLKSFGFVSREELHRILDDRLTELKDIITYFNDDFDSDVVSIGSRVNTDRRFEYYERTRGVKIRSTVEENDLVILLDESKLYDDLISILKNKFKVIDVYIIILNLEPENIVYYETYLYSESKMKSGKMYEIKTLYYFGDDFGESMKYCGNLVNKISQEIHHLRVSYDVGFSYDDKSISIRILPLN